MGKRIIGRKNIVILMTSCLFFIFLAGCGNKDVENNTLEFKKDGSVIEYIAEDFDTTVYDFEDWKTSTEADIEAYNSSGESKITMKDAKCKDGILSCTITYSDGAAFSDFNNSNFYYGTISQAISAGYSLLVPVTDINTAKTLSSSELQEMKDYRIVILTGDRSVYTYKNIECVSNNVGVGENHKKATITGDSTAYIVFK